MLSIYLDRVAVWSPKQTDGFSSRKGPVGQAYLTKDSMVYKQATKPLIRYAKNYTAGKGKSAVKFSLFVRCFTEDGKFVESELDHIAKELPREFIAEAISGASFENFTYTDIYIEEPKPEPELAGGIN